MASRGHFVFPIDAKNHKVLVIWDLNGYGEYEFDWCIVTKLGPVQAMACGGGGGDGGDGGDHAGMMRYSPKVKQLSSVGYQLFKERFVRLMGGYKNQGDGRIDGRNYTH